MQTRRMKLNILSGLLMQAVSIICAFILPRFILSAYGSTYNGIVNSINQFLSCVTLLRAGVGGVARARLYKPLADGDMREVSAVLFATEAFMRRIARIFAVLLLLFAAAYPLLVRESFDWLFSFTLVLTMGISTFVQYYFGIANQILLHADQRLYLWQLLQSLSVALNTLFSTLLILAGQDIRVVKLASAAVFCISPIVMYLYVRRRYALDRSVPPDHSAIRQRWDAFAHQVAAFVHSSTDLMVLTAFSDLYQVSIYAVYALVVNGLKQLLTTAASAVEAFLGRIIASDREKLCYAVERYEWIVHVLTTILFSCCAALIVPFVRIYTRGITDTNYTQPLFGALLALAAAIYCLRVPYQNVVEAEGHFRQTRNGAISEAALNLGISILLVGRFGCVGVAIGTIVSTLMRTVQYAEYASRELLDRPCAVYRRRFLVTLGCVSALGLCYALTGAEAVLAAASNYVGWLVEAVVVFLIVSVTTLLLNYMFYPRLTGEIVSRLILRGKRRETV